MLKKTTIFLAMAGLPLLALAQELQVYPASVSLNLLFEEEDQIVAATVSGQPAIEFLYQDEELPTTLGFGVYVPSWGDPLLVVYDTDNEPGPATILAMIDFDDSDGILLSNEQGWNDDLSFVELSIQTLNWNYECEDPWSGSLDGLRNDLYRYRRGEEGREAYTPNGVLRSRLTGLQGEFWSFGDEYLVVSGTVDAILHPRRAFEISDLNCWEPPGPE